MVFVVRQMGHFKSRKPEHVSQRKDDRTAQRCASSARRGTPCTCSARLVVGVPHELVGQVVPLAQHHPRARDESSEAGALEVPLGGAGAVALAQYRPPHVGDGGCTLAVSVGALQHGRV
eukprot:CAMPEP_0181232562 /NCGR_PEP_ID=MMETSP1096-20121128/35804_1 /TAXON_ID=156174 ORGANISM="Chrysochromulina ericina, Strain CCMP281" /NCGR_SAMPLE_ID=MMETSP1096 /ASSEMBLY_ACC=CAM_ASM_000453 /LENGTH=118 /DNA_ID=CAMNT_0023326875 /DNA_START=142 /DNA_END=499 /DNA_ORIENTATION=+